MIKKSNILSFTLGILCAGLMAYIGCTSSPSTSDVTKNDSANATSDNAKRMMAVTADQAIEDTTKHFCGIPPSTLIDLIRNYKNEVWSKTSDVNGNKLDARFIEIDINQLEQFISYAKRSAAGDGLNIASVRLYYINYGGMKKTQQFLAGNATGNVLEDFSGCHSVALVPVTGVSMADPNRRDYFRMGEAPGGIPNYNNLKNFDSENQNSQENPNLVMVPNYTCNPKSLVENHGIVCPPMTGCVTNTLLATADNE